MKVCMLSYSFYDSDGRVRRYAETLAKRGDTVDVITLRRHNQDIRGELKGVNLFRIQKRIRNETGRITYLLRLLTFFIRSALLISLLSIKNKYDLVHVHSIPDFEIFAAMIPKFMGAKIILDIHDIVPELYADKFSVDKASLAFRSLLFLEKISISFSDFVIISNHLWHKTLCSRSVSKEKCITIINYPDENIFSQSNDTNQTDNFVFLYPGTLNFHQGVDIAVKAISIIKSQAPQALLQIVGDGTAKTNLEKLVDKLNLKEQVMIKNPIPLDDVPSVMAKADVGIIPKRDDGFGGEAFSTKTLEFMLMGIPILVSRTRIDQYYFNDLLVKFFEPGNPDDLAEAMLEMIRDKAMRKRLSVKGIEFARKNSWRVKKKIYLELVEKLCRNS